MAAMKTLVRTFGFLVLALAPVSAFAHHAEWMRNRPFVQGLSMPVHGLDHMLVAISIGLLATQLGGRSRASRSEEHTSELQSRFDLVCRLLLEKKKIRQY